MEAFLKIKIRLFALYKELAGQGEVLLTLEPGATVASLKTQLSQTFPQLQGHSPLVAINGEYAPSELVIQEGDEVALLPPFSGGQS